jgi:hypothetical protein
LLSLAHPPGQRETKNIAHLGRRGARPYSTFRKARSVVFPHPVAARGGSQTMFPFVALARVWVVFRETFAVIACVDRRLSTSGDAIHVPALRLDVDLTFRATPLGGDVVFHLRVKATRATTEGDESKEEEGGSHVFRSIPARNARASREAVGGHDVRVELMVRKVLRVIPQTPRSPANGLPPHPAGMTLLSGSPTAWLWRRPPGSSVVRGLSAPPTYFSRSRTVRGTIAAQYSQWVRNEGTRRRKWPLRA